MNRPAVLVTGGAGYLGSLLSERLVEEGYDVIAYDKCLFGREAVAHLEGNENFELVVEDISNTEVLRNVVGRADHVVHLAAIVGDPACSADIDTAIRTNLYDTMSLKGICDEEGIDRFVFVSTCSVYGRNEDNSLLTETSDLNPTSLYGRSKTMCEQSLLEETGDFTPVILRLATVYGLSNRPRFDLVVNYLTKKAVTEGTGTIFGGSQWRPFVHCSDVARGIHTIIDAPTETVESEIFNVGSTDENYTMEEVGELIDELVPEAEITVDETITDDRSYRVSFDKIESELGFTPQYSVADGIKEIRDAIESGEIADPERDIYYNHHLGSKEAK